MFVGRFRPEGAGLWRLRRRPFRPAAWGRPATTGLTTVFGAQLSYPVIRSRQQTLNVYAAFDGLDSNISTTADGVRLQSSYDSLRVLRLGEDYALSDVWLGADRSAVNALSVRLSQGMKLLGASTERRSPTSPRRASRPVSSRSTSKRAARRRCSRPWDGASVALMGLLTGQWSDDILPPAEQFYLGGSRFTRGYYAGQVPGDKALAATVELQLNTGFETTRVRPVVRTSPTQFYLFYDWGETWQNLSADHAAMINSAGGGVRTQLTRYIEVDFEGLARFNRFPTWRQLAGQWRLAAVRRRFLLAGADAILKNKRRASKRCP